MIIQVLLLGFVCFVLWRVGQRYRAGDMTHRELLIWLLFWLTVAAAIIAPQATDRVAYVLGVARGADLLVYISVLVLFFITLRLTWRIRRLDRTITLLTRRLALTDYDRQGKSPDHNRSL